MGAKCNITAKQKEASDKATHNALNGALKTGAGPILNQMSAYSTAAANQAGTAKQKLTMPPPAQITKKHDVINHYLGEGLIGEQVVEAMGTHGFKIKVADVNANIKHYGTDKIPANFPKADLQAAAAKAEKALAAAQAAINAPLEETSSKMLGASPAASTAAAALTLDEKSALMEYKDSGWAINNAIKTGDFSAKTVSGAPLKDVVKDLNKAFIKGAVPLVEDTVYYRGGTLPDSGYVSLTTDKTAAAQYGPVIEVNVPKGTRVLEVGAHTTDLESEFLVKASPSLKIVPASVAKTAITDLDQIAKDIVESYGDSSIPNLTHIPIDEVVDQALMSYGASADDAYKLALKAGASSQQAIDAVSEAYDINFVPSSTQLASSALPLEADVAQAMANSGQLSAQGLINAAQKAGASKLQTFDLMQKASNDGLFAVPHNVDEMLTKAFPEVVTPQFALDVHIESNVAVANAAAQNLTKGIEVAKSLGYTDTQIYDYMIGAQNYNAADVYSKVFPAIAKMSLDDILLTAPAGGVVSGEFVTKALAQGYTHAELVNYLSTDVLGYDANDIAEMFANASAPTMSIAKTLEQQVMEISAKETAGAPSPIIDISEIQNANWIATKAKSLGATAQEAFELAQKSGAADHLNYAQLATSVEQVYGEGSISGYTDLGNPGFESTMLKPISDFENLSHYEAHYGVYTDSPEEFMSDALAKGYSQADVVTMIKKFDPGYQNPAQVVKSLNQQLLEDATGSSMTLPFYNSAKYVTTFDYAVAMKDAGFTQQQVLDQLTSQFGHLNEKSLSGLASAFGQPGNLSFLEKSIVDKYTTTGDLGDVLSESVVKEIQALGGTQQDAAALIQKKYIQQHQVPINSADANAVVNQYWKNAIAVPTPEVFSALMKQKYGSTPMGVSYIQLAEEFKALDITDLETIEKVLPDFSEGGIHSVANLVKTGNATGLATPVMKAAPTKAKIIQSSKDNKHDLIYKLRQAGYTSEEIVNQMSVYGYKIKLTDVNANIKHYGTTKIPMSPHVPKQIAMPQMSAGGAVKPAAVPNPVMSVEPLVPFEKAETVMVKRIGDAKGSNPGGLYEDADGKKWYVKQYTSPMQAKNEFTTNELYRSLGLRVPVSKVIQSADGALSIATSYIENTKTLAEVGLTKERADDILDGFAADVLTANWDAVGLELDNIIYAADGAAIRVDQGGSILFRAKGGLKDEYNLKSSIDEWTKFFDSNVNPAYKKVMNAAGVSSAEGIANIVEQLDNIAQVFIKYQNNWHNYLKVAAPQLTAQESAKFASILNSRTKLLLDKRTNILHAQKAMKALEELAKVPFNPANITFQKIEGVNSAAVKAATPAGSISVQPDTYQQKYFVVSMPPAVVLQAGPEAAAKWYIKYVPDLKAAEISKTVKAIEQSFQGLGWNKYHDVGSHIEEWMREGLSMPTQVAPARAGFAEGTSVVDKKLAEQKANDIVTSREDRNAFENYTGSGNGPINDALRKNDGPGIASYRKQIEALDRNIAKMQAPSNVVVYRGIGGAGPLHSMSPVELQRLVGARIEDLGFVSTSTSRTTANNFSGGRVVLRIHAPKGTRGAYVQNTLSSHTSEYEFIMSRGTQFTVTQVTWDGSHYVVDVDIAAQPFAGSATAQAVSTVTKKRLDELVAKIPNFNTMTQQELGVAAHAAGMSQVEYFALKDYKASLPTIPVATASVVDMMKGVEQFMNGKNILDMTKSEVDYAMGVLKFSPDNKKKFLEFYNKATAPTTAIANALDDVKQAILKKHNTPKLLGVLPTELVTGVVEFGGTLNDAYALLAEKGITGQDAQDLVKQFFKPISTAPAVATDAKGFAIKASYKSVGSMIDELDAFVGHDPDISWFELVDSDPMKIKKAAQSLGWSEVQYNTLKKYLKSGPD